MTRVLRSLPTRSTILIIIISCVFNENICSLSFLMPNQEILECPLGKRDIYVFWVCFFLIRKEPKTLEGFDDLMTLYGIFLKAVPSLG